MSIKPVGPHNQDPLGLAAPGECSDTGRWRPEDVRKVDDEKECDQRPEPYESGSIGCPADAHIKKHADAENQELDQDGGAGMVPKPETDSKSLIGAI